MWAIVSVLVPVLVTLLSRMVVIDLAYHIRAGELILTGRSIPATDTFTFTMAGASWLDQQWGAQLIMAAVNRAGGFASISLLRASLIGITFGLVYRTCRVVGAPPRIASLLSLGGFVLSLQTLAMRPQLFAVPLFAGELLILTQRTEHPRRLWAIPALTIAWTNMHGSFVLAPVLIGLALLQDLQRKDRGNVRRLALVGIATLLATLASPFGPAAWSYVVSLSTNPIIRTTITEWQPIDLSSFTGVAFFGSAAAIAGWLAIRGRPTPWPWLVWLGVFFFLTLPAARGVIWWGLVAPMVVAALLTPGPEEVRTRSEAGTGRGGSHVLDLTVVTTLVLVTLAAVPLWRPGPQSRLLSEAPQGLVAAVANAVPARTRLAVPQPWASWFEYALPSMPVMVDPRIELFPQAVWDDYNELRGAGDRWREVLDRWEVGAVVLDTRDWSLVDVIDRDPGWRLAYRDADGVLYVRT